MFNLVNSLLRDPLKILPVPEMKVKGGEPGLYEDACEDANSHLLPGCTALLDVFKETTAVPKGDGIVVPIHRASRLAVQDGESTAAESRINLSKQSPCTISEILASGRTARLLR